MRRAIREHSHLHDKREMMMTADAVKAGVAHNAAFPWQARSSHACFFTSLMLEKTMPSARSLVYPR
jgi:hypothetical protein